MVLKKNKKECACGEGCSVQPDTRPKRMQCLDLDSNKPVCVEGHFWRQSGKFEYRVGIRSYLKIMLISRYEHGFVDM